MLIELPPYAIATPVFRFRALAMHAGRGALGGEREVALACFAVARLANGMTEPFALTPGEVSSRCVAAKQWLASLSLPNTARAAANSVIDAVAAGNSRGAATALKNLVAACAAHLDQSSTTELNELINHLAAA